MKTTIALAVIVAATAAAAPAFAAENSISQLARETGLSERRVQMVLGDRTAFAEYRTSYDQSVHKFRQALGEENYQRAMNGQALLLPQVSTPATAVAVLADNEPLTP